MSWISINLRYDEMHTHSVHRDQDFGVDVYLPMNLINSISQLCFLKIWLKSHMINLFIIQN